MLRDPSGSNRDSLLDVFPQKKKKTCKWTRMLRNPCMPEPWMQGHLFVQGKAEPLLGSLKCLKSSHLGVITGRGKQRFPCADVEGGMPKEDPQDVGSTHDLQARSRLARSAWNPQSAPCRSRSDPAGAMKISLSMGLGFRVAKMKVLLLCSYPSCADGLGMVHELHEDLSA